MPKIYQLIIWKGGWQRTKENRYCRIPDMNYVFDSSFSPWYRESCFHTIGTHQGLHCRCCHLYSISVIPNPTIILGNLINNQFIMSLSIMHQRLERISCSTTRITRIKADTQPDRQTHFQVFFLAQLNTG